MLPFSNTQEYITHCLLIYRVICVFFANYSASQAITPKKIFLYLRLVLEALMTIASSFLQLVPLKLYPRLSIANRILSIPSQFYTLYVANAYVAPTLKVTWITVTIVTITIMSVMLTAFGIWTDVQKIQQELIEKNKWKVWPLPIINNIKKNETNSMFYVHKYSLLN